MSNLTVKNNGKPKPLTEHCTNAKNMSQTNKLLINGGEWACKPDSVAEGMSSIGR